MTFDIYNDNIAGLQQTYITDWLQSWQPDSDFINETCNNPSADDLISAHSDNRLTLASTQKYRMAIFQQIYHSISNDDTDVDSDGSSTQSRETHPHVH
jgi:hypothetical protein